MISGAVNTQRRNDVDCGGAGADNVALCCSSFEEAPNDISTWAASTINSPLADGRTGAMGVGCNAEEEGAAVATSICGDTTGSEFETVVIDVAEVVGTEFEELVATGATVFEVEGCCKRALAAGSSAKREREENVLVRLSTTGKSFKITVPDWGL